ncbi:hypothetical protein BDZ45DRAFT_22222 [Acephala macrosclerotiorum]|nr:hypothetical protein BDZ45DRAFT_22222 [Acephala macrosclerotiorum]
MSFSYWPGGIPAYVQVDETPIPYDDIEGLSIGWRLFIKEQWVPIPPTEQDPLKVRRALVQKRRALVAEWTQAPQSLRDDYQSRAASNPIKWNYQDLKEFVSKGEQNDGNSWYCCIAPLDTPHNRVLWAKLHILSHNLRHDNPEGIDRPGIISASPHSPLSLLETKDFMRTTTLEPADFMNMAMTVHGTVVFRFHKTILADQQSLDAGLLLLTEFKSNGDVGMSMRFSVLEFEDVYNQLVGMGRSVWWMRHFYGFDGPPAGTWKEDEVPVAGKEINLTPPILEILKSIAETTTYFEGRSEEKWRELLEKIAPEYLELEEAGNPEDYDHSRFLEM